jgi:hypothetical protein
MKYDEQILLKGAARLNARASWIIFWTATKYTVVTLLATSFAGAMLSRTNVLSVDSAVAIVAVLTVAALMVGIFVGQDRAFELRLQAQQLVALVKIEHNTHKTSLPS